MSRNNKTDFSRYFSQNKWNRVPLYKLLVSGALALTLAVGMGAGAVAWAFSAAGQKCT